MSYCYCTARISGRPASTCDDCLVANKIIVGCGQGLMPCGGDEGTTVIDLNLLNKNGTGVVYSIRKFSTDDFASVSITAAGVITIVTGEAYEAHGLHNIEYTVTKGKNKTFGTLQVCFDNPCEASCGSVCNTCSGECFATPDAAEATATCGEADKTHNAATGMNTASCDGTTTWTVTTPGAISATISSVGLITYDMTDLAIPGETYRITWKAVCSLYGMEAEGTLDVTITDLCVGVVCGDLNQECNSCTGICEDRTSDMSSDGNAITSQSSFTVSTS